MTEPRLLLIELVRARLSELLGVPIKHSLDRHKAMYLAQRAGVDAGYGFNWQPVGVLSLAFAEDLNESWRVDIDDHALNAAAEARLQSLADQLHQLACGSDDLLAVMGAAADVSYLHRNDPGTDVEAWVNDNYPGAEDAAELIAEWHGPDVAAAA